MSADVLAFRDVSVRYPGAERPAIAGVSFEIGSCERVALLGLNGAGKTTVFQAVVGLIPSQGMITVGGVTLDRSSMRAIRDKVGFLFNVPEDQLLFPDVLEDVAFGLTSRGVPRPEARERARQMLARLGARELAGQSVHKLSHGQKLRVALAGALVGDPELLLLDEPASGLDPPGKRGLCKLLQEIPAAALVATHDLEFARKTCGRYLLLNEGRLEDQGQDFSRVEAGWQ
ncbi:MAG TPA: ABC transporter ATP-binding protein [Myxococcota bacterium]|nr:ABC transporter ATP-binding protein [Myxococcota bacterium]